MRIEPIMIIAESINAVFFCQAGLALSDSGVKKIVIAKFARYMWLVMPDKAGLPFADVHPIREPFAPPGIVFGYGVVLGEIEGNGTNG